MTAPTSPIAPLFVDHSDLGNFNQVVALNAFRSKGATQSQPQPFWSTDNRPASSLVQEALEITLTNARLINWLQFDVVQFPHQVNIEYYDATSAQWTPLLDPGRNPIIQAMLHSVPSQLPATSSVPGHLHPQHSFIGHWQQLSLQTLATSVQRIRLVLQRIDNGNGPLDAFGNASDYSLAVRNFSLGYQVATRDDVPRTLPSGDPAYQQPFAVTSDLLSSSVDFTLRSPVASRILGNSDTDSDSIWKCEPQPYPNAVVCFYADLGDDVGAAPVINQIYLDPINNGAHVSLYHSDDVPVGGFDGAAIPLDTTQALGFGPIKILDNQRLDFGQYGQPSYLSLNNVPLNSNLPSQQQLVGIGYDPTLPWWFGVTVRPGSSRGVDSNEHPIIDCGTWRLSLTSGGLLLVLPTLGKVTLPIAYQSGQDTTLIVSYDGKLGFHLHARNSSDDQRLNYTTQVPLPVQPVPTIMLGADLSGTYFLNGGLSNLVLKEEVADGLDDYLVEPGVYCSVAAFAADDLPQTRNALLRQDASATQLIDTMHPWGLFGAPGAKYEQMAWTPVPRDYTMQRGWMQLPPTRARFWKLEITHLQAEYQDIHVPGPQLVKTFPPQVLAAYRQQIESAPGPQLLGPATQSSLSGVSPYADYPRYVSTGGTNTGYTNAEAYVADDYTTAQRLRDVQGENWAYQDWHAGLSAPRFAVTQVHQYTTETVTRTGKLVYTVGLRQLIFARSLATAAQDVNMYEDMFTDDANLLPGTNFVYDPIRQSLTSGAAIRAQAVSLSFASKRNLRGVQFSAQQSQPMQLLPDDDFDDPKFLQWSMYGDAQVPQGTVSSSVLGSLLPISRGVAFGFYGDIAPNYPTWGALETADVTYGALAQSTGHRGGGQGGGVSSAALVQPLGGRLYAAARVVADQDLSAPLWVQVVDAITGAVLAENSVPVKRNQVTEWYVPYTVGNGSSIVTYGDLDGASAAYWQPFADSFTRANATSLGRLDTGQSWSSPSTPLQLSSNMATVTASGQRSQVDTGTPWGTLTVKLGTAITTSTASASVPLLQLGGFVLMNDGRIVGSNTGRVLMTVPGIASNDTFGFVFQPTQFLNPALLGGDDPTVQSWSITVSHNGATLAPAITVTRAISTVRALMGAVGQQFQSFAWTPSTVGKVSGHPIASLPMPTDGAQSPDGTLWTQGNGHVWNLVQPLTFATDPVWQASANTVTTSTSGGAGSTGTVTTNVTDLYGTLSFQVTQLPSYASPYQVAILDVTSGTTLALFSDGSLRSVPTSGAATVLASGVMPSLTAGDVQIKFAATATLSAAFRSAYSISLSSPQTLIFLSNDAVVGTYSGTGVWSGSTRGVTLFNNGASAATIITGFAWSPDASTVPLDTSHITWANVDGNGTKTWGDLSGTNSGTNSDQIQVRVIQKGSSQDSWYMDTLSLFSDPIVWEFSSDGGHNWVPAYDVRNDPQGVVAFQSVNALDPNSVGNQLCYRVTAWGPGVWISHLAIRPWYQGFTHCVPSRPQGSVRGPNINPHDHYPPIEQDPRWRVWHLPVPREWWFAFRNLTH